VALVIADVSEERTASIISVLRLLVTTNFPSSPIIVILMMEAIRSSDKSVLTKATSLKTALFIVTAVKTSFYVALTGWAL
jgi:hypothetical protein